MFIVLLLAVSLFSGMARGVEKPKESSDENRPLILDNVVLVKLHQQPVLVGTSANFGISSLDRIMERIHASAVTPLRGNASLNKANMSREEQSLARIIKVRYAADIDPRTLAAEIASDPNVEYAEPYYLFRKTYTPNDPRLGTQWNLAMMKMEQAWDITKGDSTIVIGYIDSGVNYTHEDLKESLWINPGEWGASGELSANGIDDDANGYIDDYRGWDFFGNGTGAAPVPDNDPMDMDGHGTSGAAIAAARTDNGKGVAGVGFNTKILAIKAENDAGTTGIDGYDGITYAADMGCKVINCSWGDYNVFSQALQDIVDYAYSKGALVVGSAGNRVLNNDIMPFMPGNLMHAMSVGSMAKDGTPSPDVSYGASVDIHAPGVELWTARQSFGYQSVEGTSFAAPHISGLAALIWSIHPTWTPDQVKKQIRVTATTFSTTPDAETFGYANAYRALSTNSSLQDIPGINVRGYTISTPSGAYFGNRGETATIQIQLENLLAPTTAGATATLVLDAGLLTSSTSTLSIGAVPNMGTKNLNFQVKLSDNPLLSEGYVPVVLKITDGTYVDFVLVRIPMYLPDSWHTRLNLLWPYNSISVVDQWTVWVSGDYKPTTGTPRDIALRTEDGGDTWTFAFGDGYPDGSGVYCIHGIDYLTAIIGTGPSTGAAEIYRTDDGGSTWVGFPVSNMTPFVNIVHMFDANNGLFQGDPKDGLWAIGKTSDGGRTWSRIANCPVAPSGEAGWNNSYEFIGDVGYFGTNNSVLYKTVDRGENWTPLPVPNKNSTDLSFRDAKVGVIRFSSQNGEGNDTLAVTQDGGATWSLVSTINAPYGSVVFETGGKKLWYIRGDGAFVTDDLCKTWKAQAIPHDMTYSAHAESWNDGFTTYVYSAGNKVYSFETLFEKATSVSPLAAAAGDFRIDNVYPNPVSSSAGQGAVVSFSLDRVMNTSLTVYDMAGRLVQRGFNATMAPGSHSVRLSTSGLAAGTYSVRLTAENQTAARTIVIVR